jgi:adenylyl-sulfate kinase
MKKKTKKKKQEGFVLWFTGLSGAGKSTLADRVYGKLEKTGRRIERLDGDIVRKNLTKDLGFSREDRARNIERVAFVCQLLSKHGVGVVASFISPYKSEREYVRKICKNFVEVHVNTPLEICEQRDKKDLYAKARRGEIKNFTGISDPYEIPENPHLRVCGDREERIKKITDEIVRYVNKRCF